MVKNKVIENRPVAEVIIDAKAQKQPETMTYEKAKEIVEDYKKRCERFPVRMLKFERKKEELKAWVNSFKKGASDKDVPKEE